MAEYTDAERLSFLDLRDSLETELTTAGLRMAESAVHLVTVTTADADLDAGKPGTATPTQVAITPRPTVDLRDQWRTVAGERVRVGDGLITFTRAVTREEILAAAYFLIDGVKYRLVDGWLKRKTFRWEAIVTRIR